MPRITKVYTRTGDDGTTALGTGQRVPKESQRIEAYGQVDDVNAQIGCVLTCELDDELRQALTRIQNQLFHVGADLCIPDADKSDRPGPRIEQRHVDELERLMDRLTERVPPLENFVLPGGTPAAAQLHVARTSCRAAERAVTRLMREEAVSLIVIRYLNRLSDALFVMGRYQNHKSGMDEPVWNSRE
jgi:cob(I)alamin adenosyltransferase